MNTLIRTIAMAVFGAAILAAMPARAADGYPAKQIHIVVPFPPGGSIDMVTRLIGQKLSEGFDKPVVVSNRPGASGNIGMEYVARAPADGYTLVLAPFSVATASHLFLKLPFDPLKDLKPIIRVADQPNVLVVNADKVKANSVKELVAHLKAHPDELSFGTSGIGNPQDFSARTFMVATGTKMLNVAYKGGAPALSDLMGGHIDLMFETSPTAVPYVLGGKLKALAVTSDKRLSTLPDVPTLDEAGITGYKAIYWMGLLASGKTPQPIIEKLNAEVRKILATSSVRKQIEEISLYPGGGTPEEFGDLIRSESAIYARLIEDLDIPRQ